VASGLGIDFTGPSVTATFAKESFCFLSTNSRAYTLSASLVFPAYMRESSAFYTTF